MRTTRPHRTILSAMASTTTLPASHCLRAFGLEASSASASSERCIIRRRKRNPPNAAQRARPITNQCRKVQSLLPGSRPISAIDTNIGITAICDNWISRSLLNFDFISLASHGGFYLLGRERSADDIASRGSGELRFVVVTSPWRSLRVRPVAPKPSHRLLQNGEGSLATFGSMGRRAQRILTHRIFDQAVQE